MCDDARGFERFRFELGRPLALTTPQRPTQRIIALLVVYLFPCLHACMPFCLPACLSDST